MWFHLLHPPDSHQRKGAMECTFSTLIDYLLDPEPDDRILLENPGVLEAPIYWETVCVNLA